MQTATSASAKRRRKNGAGVEPEESLAQALSFNVNWRTRTSAFSSYREFVPPESEAQALMESARCQFEDLVQRGDNLECLGKAALLIALEEEAAAMHTILLEGLSWGAAEDELELGSEMTWSLSRLDALASEAKAAFETACRRDWDTEAASPSDYPVTALESLNHVLFERHGYTRPNSHHNNSPDNSLLPKVLEQGSGSPLLLGVLYIEVARRMGLILEGAPLSEGPGSDYFVVWPQMHFGTCGMELVIDAYDKGQLWKKDEMMGLFDKENLEPAGQHEMLCSMLGSLRDAYWARAIGCQAEPNLMIPISLRDAAEGTWAWGRQYFFERALAAVEKQILVLRDEADLREAHMQRALLLYHAGKYDDAWVELGALQEALCTSEDKCAETEETLKLLVERVRLQLMADEQMW
eukprot:CAMPEP_0118928032 /NCGR_PEP_ID=MMETSP1169-20130426/5382_1 /TAXON_ID=36882 /ORGANISM="Pyramimonas obovata, Strain CCMP722" /LENGTH=409 /DNA_ID=CAMNT_0006869925 /DNA_START=280 /DNA_END=1507 /DNA_ORIENTATION=-